MSDREWERRRAVIGALEIAIDALNTASAMINDGEDALVVKELANQIYLARVEASAAYDKIPPLEAFRPSPTPSAGTKEGT